MAPVQQIKMGDICDGFVETPGDTLRAARGKVYSIITFPLIVMTNPRDAKDERESRDVLLNKEDLMRLALCDNCDFKLPDAKGVGIGLWIAADDKLVRWSKGRVCHVAKDMSIGLVTEEGKEEVETLCFARNPWTGTKPALGFR
ncbi:hypothetical protein ASPCAL04876 [Aspergillus calidoustus]|uniref:Uncharacterized protein n=1 Tax=Aspergillus calidoustus TaxID=454130 RepID=A0A0U5FVS4_ASPCI|nr:hypothetical protein ASPCAL04876 [Aspergillus calidoustus]